MGSVVLDVKNAEDSQDATHQAVEALAAGKIVAFPTETVYGIACSALNESAVQRLSEIKNRSSEHPFTLAVKSIDDALDYIPEITNLAHRLGRRCWPGPLTLVLKDNHDDSVVKRLPEAVQQSISLNGTIGLRVPAHPIILSTMRLCAGPLVLTSANLSGQPVAETAEEIVEAFGDDVDLVLDDGKCRYGQPSTVVKVLGDEITMLREGVLSEANVQRLAEYVIVMVCTGNTCRSPMAEALMKKQIADKLGCKWDELDQHRIKVISAGIAAGNGHPVSMQSVEVMKERGLDIADHESQPMTDQLVMFADHILTMTKGHWQAIVSYWPDVANRTSVVSVEGHDVSDPIGAPIEVYRSCAEQIDGYISDWIEKFDLPQTKKDES